MKRISFLISWLLFAGVAFAQFTESQYQYLANRNYITNPGGEQGLSGCRTYADTAGSSPEDGTGGSPTTTWTLTSSSPLNGTHSFVITKDASNRQGEGVGCDFILPASEKTHVQRISFNYAVSSGTLSFGDGTVATPSDVRVFIYDVTNSRLIEPTNTLLSGSGKYLSEFQASPDSTSYRLILHVATTSSSAWVLKVDNIQVGPRDVARGAIAQDNLNYAAPTGSWSSNTTYSAKYSRIGNKLLVNGSISLSGAPTNVSLTINLPSGLSIDTSNGIADAGSANPLGQLNIQAHGGGNNFVGQITYSSTTSVLATWMESLTSPARIAYVNFNATSPITFASGDVIDFWYMVPIQGWGSNMQVSSDTGTKLVTARYHNAAGTTITDGSNVFMDFPTSDWDTSAGATGGGGGFNATYTNTWRYIVPENGYYDVDLFLATIAGSTATTRFRAWAAVNGSTEDSALFDYQDGGITNTKAYTYSGHTIVKANAGQAISIGLFKSGATMTLDNNSAARSPRVIITKRSSPQSIGMAEKVHAVYTHTAGTSITNNSATTITAWNKVIDDFNAFNSGVFTVPVTGRYLVTGQMGWASASHTAVEYSFQAIQAGSSSITRILSDIFPFSTFTGLLFQQFGGPVFDCQVGDTITIKAYQNESGARSLYNSASFNYIDIMRLN